MHIFAHSAHFYVIYMTPITTADSASQPLTHFCSESFSWERTIALPSFCQNGAETLRWCAPFKVNCSSCGRVKNWAYTECFSLTKTVSFPHSLVYLNKYSNFAVLMNEWKFSAFLDRPSDVHSFSFAHDTNSISSVCWVSWNRWKSSSGLLKY